MREGFTNKGGGYRAEKKTDKHIKENLNAQQRVHREGRVLLCSAKG